MNPHVEFPEVAGGFGSGTLAVGDVAMATKGCRLVHTGEGTWECHLHTPVPIGRLRFVASSIGPQVPLQINPVHISPTLVNIFTSAVIDDDGSVVLDPADFSFSFGVSLIPE